MKAKGFTAGVLLLCLALVLSGCVLDPQQAILAAAKSKTAAEEQPEASALEQDVAEASAWEQEPLVVTLTSEEAQALIQGNLDSMFRGIFSEEYQALIQASEEELRQAYLDGLDIEADVFEGYFGIEYDNEALRARIVAFYEQVYPQCEFTVGEAVRDGDGFTAQVTVRPLNIIELTVEDMQAAAEPFSQYYTQEMVETMTDEEYMAYDAAWAELVLTVAEANLPDMDYLPERTTQVRVELEDGYWMLTDESLQELDLLMIQY